MLERTVDGSEIRNTVVGVATIKKRGNYAFTCTRLDGASGINLQWEYVDDPKKTLQVTHLGIGVRLTLDNVENDTVGLYRCKDGRTNETEDILMTLGTFVCVCVCVCVW